MFFAVSGHSPLSPDGRTGGLKQNASFEGNRMPIKDIRKILDCKFGNLSIWEFEQKIRTAPDEVELRVLRVGVCGMDRDEIQAGLDWKK